MGYIHININIDSSGKRKGHQHSVNQCNVFQWSMIIDTNIQMMRQIHNSTVIDRGGNSTVCNIKLLQQLQQHCVLNTISHQLKTLLLSSHGHLRTIANISSHKLMLYFFPGLICILFSHFCSFMVVWGFGRSIQTQKNNHG